jgi:tetratricopeptide (TPR) repeat protein
MKGRTTPDRIFAVEFRPSRSFDAGARMVSARSLGFAVMMTFLSAIGLAAQGPMSSDLQRRQAYADSLLLNGAFQPAADAYRTVIHDDSLNDVAWYRLGVSLERVGARDDALAAFSRATTFSAQQLGAELGMTRILAQQPGQTERALDHLRRAAKAGVDPTILDQASALAPLRALPQFAEIRQTAEAVRYPCRNVHTFDFWAGDFDAAQWNGPPGRTGGRLHNTRDYDGCVFVEHWMPNPGGGPAGTSTAFYDTNRKAWRFFWIDDNNGSIEFEGQYRDGAMRFEGALINADGSKALARNVLQSVAADTVRHTFSVSNDGGKTWTVQADDRFIRRHNP